MRTAIVFATALLCSPAVGEDLGGELNPDEMSLSRSFDLAKRGKVGMVVCSQGYLMTKKGDHREARALFEACAKQGFVGTMTWMSYMDTNGFGAEVDAERAAEWDRKASQAGDPIGDLNHGLNLLRGHGVERDIELAKKFIDRAADSGVQEAVELQKSGYDWNVATPDADNWRYEKRIY